MKKEGLPLDLLPWRPSLTHRDETCNLLPTCAFLASLEQVHSSGLPFLSALCQEALQ